MIFSALPKISLRGRILLLSADHEKGKKLDKISSESIKIEIEALVSVGLEKALEGGFIAILIDLTSANPPLDSLSLFHDFLPGVPIMAIIPEEDSTIATVALQAGAQDCLYPEEMTAPILNRAIHYATERTRLIESQRRFAEVVAMNADGIVVVDNDGVVLYVNPVAERVFGISAEEFRGRLFGFPINEKEFTEIELVLEGSGKIIAELRSSQIEWEGRFAYLISVRDITERKEAEQKAKEQAELMRGILDSMKVAEDELRRSEHKLSTMFRLIPSAIALIRVSDGKITDFNDGLIELLGFTRDELQNSPLDQLNLIVDTSDGYRIQQYLLAEGSLKNAEIKIRRSDGKIRTINSSVELLDFYGEQYMLATAYDITDRKEHVEALRVSRQEFMSLVNSIGGIIWEGNPQTMRFTFVSQQAEKILGYPVEKWLNEPTFWIDHIHPEDQGWLVETCKKLTQQGEAHELEYRMISSWGSTVWLKDLVSMTMENGVPVKSSGVMIDITGMKMAEQALRKHSHRQTALNQLGQMALAGRSLEDVMKEAVFLVSTILKTDLCEVLELQPDGSSMLLRAGQGIDPDDIGKLTIEGGFNSQAGYALLSRKPVTVRDLTKHTPFKIAAHLRKVNVFSGLTVIVHSTSGPYGTLSVYTKSERDFTSDEAGFLQAAANVLSVVIARSKADQMLRESEERYRTLFEESRDAVYISTVDGTILDINHAGVEMFGYSSRAEMQNIQIQNHLYLNPGEREAYIQKIDSEGFIQDYEINMKRKDGQILNILETSTVIRNEDHRIVGYRGILRDVTHLKHLQQQLMHSQKMETIGQLAGGIAHDFNNILMAILSYSEILTLKVSDKNPLFHDISGIKKAAEQGMSLTKQMLAFSRKQVLQPEVVDLNQAMLNMEQMIRRLIGEDIELMTLYSSELGRIRVDQGQFEQVILNLAINARDAMPQGGKLIIETLNRNFQSDQPLPLPEMHPGPYVNVSVTDTGCGIPDNALTKIFEPFFTTKEKGTGLGLSTVYGIVKQSGGHISVYSEVGRGTVFRIYFPMLENQHKVPPPPEKILISQLKGTETILLVDDNESVRKAVGSLLEMNGYKVYQAENGKEALQKLKSQIDKLDLLITDVVMPQMGGRELANLLTAVKPNTKTLFMSGYSEEAVQLQGILAPETFFLSKPAAMPQLLRKVREILDSDSNG